MEHEDEKERRGIQSIEVGGQILVALSDHASALSLKQLAEAAQMTPAKAHPYLSEYYSVRICGNRMTSRIAGESVSSITRRSMPMPQPPVGGMPNSSARM